MTEIPVVFDAAGDDNTGSTGHWTGAVVTHDITVYPNSGFGGGASASMFLDNDRGQVWEFFSDVSGNFGVFDKTTNNEAFEMAPADGFGQYNWTQHGGLSLEGHFAGGVFTQTSGPVTIGTDDFVQLLNGATAIQLPD